MDYIGRLSTIYREGMDKVRDLQTWPGHFLVKETDTEIIARHFEFKREYRGLELGCGNAFQSILLSGLCGKLFASDLFNENSASHTVGMERARKMIDALNPDNLKLISSSATEIPFPDNYFDFVFSSSVLEHMENKEEALLEMRRVLKPTGFLIIIVPTHMPCLYAYLHVFLYPLARLYQIAMKRNGSSHNIEGESYFVNNKEEGIVSRFLSASKQFTKNHPSFPIPELHGNYPSVFHELFQQLPFKWAHLIKNSNFKIMDSFSLCCIPWLLMEPFSTTLASKLYSHSRHISIRFGKNRILRYVSYLVGFVAKKEVDSRQ